MASLQLVFPPLTGVNYPYLSTPSLMAYVLEKSSHPVSQIDLNMAVVDWLLQPQTVDLWIERAKDTLARFKGREIEGREVVEYARAASLAVRGDALLASLPVALRTIRSKEALADPARIAHADKVIAEALEAASVAHPPRAHQPDRACVAVFGVLAVRTQGGRRGPEQPCLFHLRPDAVAG